MVGAIGFLGQIGRTGLSSPSRGGGVTVLRRETSGAVTVQSLAPTWTPILTRQPNGSIIVTGNG